METPTALRRRPRPPAALVALLGATVLLCLGWNVAVPPFQAPDENAHFAYVQKLAERGEIPESGGAPRASTELDLAIAAAHTAETQQRLVARPEWNESAQRAYLRRAERLPDSARGNGGPDPAGVNPPLYYLWELPPYWLASGGDVFARVTAMRLWSIPLLLITVCATWMLAGIVFGQRRDLQLAAAAVPALMPMVTFISSSITPDALLYALWSVAFLLGARVLVGRGGGADLAALFGVFGLAVATKSISFALAPALLLVVGVVLWRNRHRRRLVVGVLAGGGLLLALTAGAWFVVASGSGRSAAPQLTQFATLDNFDPAGFASYLWQFYLPRLGFQSGYPGMPGWPPIGWEFWVEKSWGAFGWLEVQWPMQVYWLLGACGLAVGVAAAVAVWRRRDRASRPLLAFFGLGIVTLLFSVHWTEFRQLTNSGTLFNQGRYLFPLISIAGLAAAAALSLVPARARLTVLGAAVGALGVLELLSIGLTAARFYA